MPSLRQWQSALFAVRCSIDEKVVDGSEATGQFGVGERLAAVQSRQSGRRPLVSASTCVSPLLVVCRNPACEVFVRGVLHRGGV